MEKGMKEPYHFVFQDGMWEGVPQPFMMDNPDVGKPNKPTRKGVSTPGVQPARIAIGNGDASQVLILTESFSAFSTRTLLLRTALIFFPY